MGNYVVVEQVLILFFIIIIGYYGRRKDIINADMSRKLSELLLKVTMPLLIVTSFHIEYSREMLRNAGLVFLCSFAIHVGSILAGKLLYYRHSHTQKSVLKFVTVFSNCGFMGFPVLESIFGSIGIFYGSIYAIPFNILVWTYGMMVFDGEKGSRSWRKALINPGTVAVSIGMIIFLFPLRLPFPIYRAASLVGTMTTPLAMLIVGSLLAGIRFEEMFKGFSVYYGTAARLIIMPLLTLVIMKALAVPQDVLYISVVLTAMPAAANTAIFAEKCDGDAGLASRCIGISTVLSIVTIPLILLLI